LKYAFSDHLKGVLHIHQSLSSLTAPTNYHVLVGIFSSKKVHLKKLIVCL